MEHWNLNRAEDVLRIAADATGARFEELASAQLLWIDRLGMYLYIQVGSWAKLVIDVTPQRQVPAFTGSDCRAQHHACMLVARVSLFSRLDMRVHRMLHKAC